MLEEASRKYADIEMILAPDAVHLGRYISSTGSDRELKLAIQDISSSDQHPHTGSIALHQVDTSIEYVIVGHSERRKYDGESVEYISQKVQTVEQSRQNLIFCVGETRRSSDVRQIKREIADQLESIKGHTGDILICYEPSWAIGSGSIPEQGILADIF